MDFAGSLICVVEAPHSLWREDFGFHLCLVNPTPCMVVNGNSRQRYEVQVGNG